MNFFDTGLDIIFIHASASTSNPLCVSFMKRIVLSKQHKGAALFIYEAPLKTWTIHFDLNKTTCLNKGYHAKHMQMYTFHI